MTFNNIQLGKGFMDQDFAAMEPSFSEKRRSRKPRPQTAKFKQREGAMKIHNGVPLRLSDEMLSNMSSLELKELIKSQ